MPCLRFSMRIAAFQLLRIWKGNKDGADYRQARGHVESGLRFEHILERGIETRPYGMASLVFSRIQKSAESHS